DQAAGAVALVSAGCVTDGDGHLRVRQRDGAKVPARPEVAVLADEAPRDHAVLRGAVRHGGVGDVHVADKSGVVAGENADELSGSGYVRVGRDGRVVEIDVLHDAGGADRREQADADSDGAWRRGCDGEV